MKKELYRFTEGANVWTYTSSDAEIVHASETYIPETITSDDREQKNELSKAKLTVKFPIGNSVARRWNKSILEKRVNLTIFVNDGISTYVDWKGRLVSTKPEGAEIKLIFESIQTAQRRIGLREKGSRSCSRVLYERGCYVDKSLYEVSTPVTAMDGLLVTAPNAALQPDGWYNGGFIVSPEGSARFIVAHIGSQLTLINPLESLSDAFAGQGYGMGYGLTYGQLICSIYPGCDRTKETCKNKFNNILNNNSTPFRPSVNPFGGAGII